MEYFARYYRNTVRELQRPTAANCVALRFTLCSLEKVRVGQGDGD